MIIIGIKSLPVQDHTNIPEILIRINNTVSGTLGCEADNVRSYWEILRPGFDVIGTHAAAKVHEDSHPPIVIISGVIDFPREKINEIFKNIGKILSTELAIDETNAFEILFELVPSMVYDGHIQVKV